MEVIFRTRRLQRNYEDANRATIDWGRDVSRRYVRRIDELSRADGFSQLYDIPTMRLHPLRGSRAGELSIYLTGRWRLIVTRGATRRRASSLRGSATTMTTSGEPIYSNLAIPPGETIAENIESLGMSVSELAAALSLSVEAMDEVIVGDRAITPDIAVGLADALGISAQFWLNGEAHYRATLAHNWEKTGGRKEEWTDWCFGRLLRKYQHEDAADRAAV